MIATESARRDTRRSTGVLVPLRSLHAGKLRLRDALSDGERADLIRAMAETVVRAAHDLPVLVVHDDDEVADWAARLGVRAMRAIEPGLNRAVAEGRAALVGAGCDFVLVAHADLPMATDLRVATGFDGITIVPDRLRDGTNVLCVPADLDFAFSYGPASFETHLRLAKESGRAVRVLDDDELGWDIDHPDDLALLPHATPTQEPSRSPTNRK